MSRDPAVDTLLACAGGCRNLIESGVVGVMVGDFGGSIVHVNAHFLALSGYSRDDLPLRWERTLAPDPPAVGQERARTLVESGEVPSWDTYLTRKDSVRVPALVAVTRLGNAGLGCVAFVVDRTRAHEAEAALERTRALQAALFDLSPSLSVTLDQAGVIVDVNEHGAGKLGYGKSDLIGRPVSTLVEDDDRGAFGSLLEDAKGSEDSVASRELRLRRRDGATLWTTCSVRSVPAAEGAEWFLLVSKDVTKLKATEAHLRAHKDRLRVLTSALALAEEQERRRIAAGLHDEVGHGLALAQIRLGMLERDIDTGNEVDLSPVRELVAEAIGKIRRLTFDLTSPVLYEIGLAAAIQSVAERMAEATGIPFDFVTDHGPEPDSEDSRVLLFRSVRELFLNVAKHAGAKAVKVTMGTSDGALRIDVVDDGVGFDTSEVLSPLGAGLGHGLLRAVEEMRAIGGSLSIDSTPGEGTHCRIVAPLGATPPEAGSERLPQSF